MLLEPLRKEVCNLNQALPKNNLVVWTMGNVSARDPQTNLVVIKPSGLVFEELTPENMVVVDMEANIIEGNLKYSSDTKTHLTIYKHRSDINGIVHTHSNYATAFAAAGKPIPANLTEICDEFGGPIPVGGFCLIGNEAIGEEVVRSIGNSKGILMQNHGVFTIGETAKAAVKAAVMVENAAKTTFIASMLGGALSIDPEMVKSLHDRYKNEYGQ
ncbi:MAG: L-ribulose-5-phosphate 4-epimerase [Chloroflexi bacterium HGW-Chloroflexi-10]|nr:MAG: L-ribulose-5-phosphate 4-epimerase [Chloroflexi bacterium HGW-Chloroflexi-10]